MKIAVSPMRQFIFSAGVLLLAAAARLWLIAHVPQGLFTDESFHLLRAQEIVRGQALPVFITGNNGYEPLFVYLVAGLLPILGPVNWVGRLAAAWLGLISVAATIRAGRELFPGRLVGPLAGLTLATLLWSLTLSRFGSQQIVAATASAAALAAFWHGIRTRSKWAYALAGLSLGLGLDGYVAFRLFPGVLLVAGLALLIGRHRDWRQWIVGGATTAGVAALVFAPLAWFFIHNPQWFLHRFNQTTAQVLNASDRLPGLTSNLLKVIGGLFVAGDQNWRNNLAGRPALDIAQALFFGMSLVVMVKQWRRPETWALLAWLIIGLAPSVITIDAPHFGRTTMAMPAVVLFVALGVEAVWRWGRGRVVRGLVVVAVVCSGLLSVRDFFGRWASAPELLKAYSDDQVQLAQAVTNIVPQGANLYLYTTSIAPPDWSLEYMLGAHRLNYRVILGHTNCQFLPPHSADDAYVVSDDPATSAELNDLSQVETVVVSPQLEVDYLPARTGDWPVYTLRLVRFGEVANMVGYTLTPESPVPGQDIKLTVIWQVNHATATDYKIFVHLLGSPKSDGSPLYAQLDMPPCGDAYPTSQWQTGDVLAAMYSLKVPADLLPASYTLALGWYDEAAALRLPVADDAGQPLGDSLPLARLKIGPNSP